MTPILALLLAFPYQYTPPADLDYRTVNIVSEGVRIFAEVFTPKSSAGIKAYNRAKSPKKLEVIKDITHYCVYTTAREQAHKLSEAWFDQYLKGAK